MTVNVATEDGTAKGGLDYIGISNTLSFAPGERVNLVGIPILNNGLKQPKRSFRLTLANPMGGAVLGTPTNTTVSIFSTRSIFRPPRPMRIPMVTARSINWNT